MLPKISVKAPAGSLARAVAIGLVAAAVGFGLIAWRTASLAAPTLSRPLFNINVEGRIADIQRLPEGVRVVLEAVRLKGSGVPPVEMTPIKLRVSLTKGAPPLHVGDRILVLANLSPATSEADTVRFNLINPQTNNRIKMKTVDAGTGDELSRSDLVKGFAIAKNQYVLLDKEDFESVKLESTRIIDIESFVPAASIDLLGHPLSPGALGQDRHQKAHPAGRDGGKQRKTGGLVQRSSCVGSRPSKGAPGLP